MERKRTREPRKAALAVVTLAGFLLLVAAALYAMRSSFAPQAAEAHESQPQPARVEQQAPGAATPPAADGPVPCTGGEAAGYPCDNVELLAHLPLEIFGSRYGNDLWGWSDPETGNDYVLFGVDDGLAFVDITEPSVPVYLGKLPTRTYSNLWHDVKVYDDHAFVVSEASGHGMQIFDLRQLRDVTDPPVTFEETAHYDAFGRAHNIAINPETGYAYAVDTNEGQNCRRGMHIVDVGVPVDPAFAGCYEADGIVHDTQCVVYQGPDPDYQGREVCFNSSVDDLTIVDVTDKESPTRITSQTYDGLALVHQGWLTEDQRYFLSNDEFDEINYGMNTRIYIWDVTGLDAPELTGVYEGPTRSTGHNLTIRGDYVYAAHYTQGVRIYRLADLAQGRLEEVAYLDTYPANDAPGWYHGAWTACPCFDDPGIVAVSTIDNGLFIVRPQLPDG
ncbi:MAG: choice-of-anchor B family protein [Anaerolineae bacterium]|nr:choice-of-anchor B family protein [Anaerolineae bacterium]